jgi:hypothetical protein
MTTNEMLAMFSGIGAVFTLCAALVCVSALAIWASWLVTRSSYRLIEEIKLHLRTKDIISLLKMKKSDERKEFLNQHTGGQP